MPINEGVSPAEAAAPFAHAADSVSPIDETKPPETVSEHEAVAAAGSALIPYHSPLIPTSDPILSSGVLGRFQIRAVLGQGAFGTVYRAFDPVLDRDVALKSPRAGVTDAEQAARIIDEAKAAAKLKHPNIVTVYEAGAAGDDLYIASELVPGRTLAEHMGREAVEPRQAAEWVRRLAEALAYAHKQGVVHRDVKPHNVMLNSDGRAQLMDFGLATRADTAIPLDAVADAGKTGVIGTPAYMSPEQASGQDAGPAGDQYSLGVVLYELLTGRTPFGCAKSGGMTSTSELLQKLREQNPPRVRSIRRHIARDLASVCEKAIARDPRRRYSSCQGFADDLGRWLAGELVLAHRYSPPELGLYWARRHPGAFGWIAAAACLLFALLGAGVAVGVQTLAGNGGELRPATTPAVEREPAQPPADRAAVVPSESTAGDVENYEAEVLAYARLLDRARYAYHGHEIIKADEYLEQTRWDFRDWEYAYLRRLITGGSRTFYGHRAAISAVAFHPNGQRVASASADGTVRVWNVVTGDHVALLDHRRHRDSAVTGVAFSTDGKHLFTTEGLFEQAQPTFGPGGPMMMPAPAEAPAEPAQVGARRSSPQENRYRIQVWDAETGERIAEFERLAPQTPIVGLALSPDGLMLATASIAAPSAQDPNAPRAPQPGLPAASQPQLIPAPASREPNGNEANGEPQPELIQVPGGPPGELRGPMMAQPGGELELWDVALRKLVRTIAVPETPPRQIAWSADGKFIGAALVGGFGTGGFQSWNVATGEPAAALPGDFAALAFPLEGAQFAAAPAQHLALLEQGRRRSEGAESEVRVWPFLNMAVRAALEPTDPPAVPEASNELPAAQTQPESIPPGLQDGMPGMSPPMFPDQSISFMPLAGLPAAVRSLAFAPADALTPGYGNAALAVAGGDALLAEREGNIRLWYPTFDPMGHADLWGHTGRVNTVAHRADGKQIVTGGADGLVKVWTTEVAPEVIKAPEYMSATRVAFSRDGRFLAVGHRSKNWTEYRGFGESFGQRMHDAPGGQSPEPPPDNIKIHDVRNGRELLKLASPGGDVVGLVFHPRGEWLAAATSDGTVTLWDLQSSRSIATFRAPAPLACLDVSPDGEFLAAGCTLIRSASEGTPGQPGAAPPPAMSMPAAPAVAPELQSIVIWRASEKSVAATIPAHADGVVSVAISLDGKRLASAGLDGRVRLWDIESSRAIVELEPHDGIVVDLAFRPDSRDIAGAVMRLPCQPGYPGEVVIWDAATGGKNRVIAAHAQAAYSVAYSRDGRRLASCGGAAAGSLSQPGEVKVWHAHTGIELLPLAGSAGRDTKQAFYYKEETYTVMKPVYEMVTKQGERDGEKVTYEETVMKMVPEMHTRTVPGGASRVWWEIPGAATDVAFSDDGFRLAAACEDGTARIWDGFIYQPHHTARWPAFSANAIAQPVRKFCGVTPQLTATADGRSIIVADSAANDCVAFSGIVRVFDAQTGRVRRVIGPFETPARALAMSSNNRWLAIALHSPAANVPIVMQQLPDGSMPAFAQQPDGAMQPLKQSGGVEVWDIERGERVSEFNVHTQEVLALAFDPSGTRVVSGGGDGVRLWDAESGSEIRAAKTAGAVLDVVWNSDRSVALATTDSHNKSELAIWETDGSSPPQRLKSLPNGAARGRRLLVFDAATGRAILAWTLPGANAPAADGIYREGTERAQLHFIPIDKPDDSQFQTIGRGYLQSLALSSDGKQFATVGDDWSVNVWNADRRTRLLHLTGHLEDASAAIFLADGRIASIGADRQLKVWRVGDAIDRIAGRHESELPRKRALRLGGASGMHGGYGVLGGHGMHAGQGMPGDDWRFAHVTRLAAARRAPLIVTAHVAAQNQRGFRHPVRAFDAKSGAELPQWPGHTDVVRGVAVRPDGEQIASGAQDLFVALWAADNSSKIDLPHSNKVMHVAYSPDGSRVASSTAFDGKVWIWDAHTGQPVRNFQADPITTFALAYNPDGDLLATGGIGRSIALRNAETGEVVRTLEGHADTLQHVTFSHDGRWLVSASHDKTAKLWNVETGELVRTFQQFTTPVWESSFSPDDRLLAVASVDPSPGAKGPDSLRILEVETGELVKELVGHERDLWSVAFSPDGKHIAACGRDQSLIVWDWERGEQLFTAAAAGECLAYWPDGSRIVTGNVFAARSEPQPKFDSIVRAWNTETLSPHGSLKLNGVQVVDLAVAPDGTRVAIAGQDGSVRVWEGRANEELPPAPTAEFQASDRAIWAVAFSVDGSSIATASHDDVVRVWTASGEQQFELKPAGGPRRLVFHRDGQQLAIGCADRNVRVWNLTTRQETAVFKRHFGDVTDLEYSPDGSRLAVTSRRGEPQGWTGDLKVWDVATGRRIVSTRAHSWWDARLAFHPTQPHVAITGIDHTVQVRHAETGQLVLTIPTQGHMSTALGFTHTGDRLILARGGEVLMVDPTPESSPLGSASGAAAATVTQSAADEAATRWVLEKGGRVHVRADGIVEEIATVADLPTDPYVLAAVLIGGGRGDITDVDVALLKPLEHLTTLQLDVPGVTDAVIDALAEIKTLQNVNVQGTKITAEGAARLQAALPNCQVHR